MVARGKGRDTGLPFLDAQLRHGVIGAAEFKRAGALEVFALEIHTRAGRAVGGRRGQYRRLARDARQPRSRLLNIRIYRRRQSRFRLQVQAARTTLSRTLTLASPR